MHDPIFDIFREEAREHLKMLEQGFLELDTTQDLAQREQLIGVLFRHAHNIKGDTRALDLVELQRAAAILEETLERLRENPAEINSTIIEKGLSELDALLQAYERWHREFDAASTGNAVTPAAANEAGKGSLSPLETGPDPNLPGGSTPWLEDVLSVRVSSERLDRMLNVVGEVRVLQRSDGEMQRQLRDLRGRLDEMSQRLNGESRPLLESVVDQIRRIEIGLHQQQTQEQVLMQSLEEDISAARLLPLTMLADSLRRPIRDLARSLGKEVRYQVDVKDVLLDKAVIESLRAPLLHLIRNAVDHGIEAASVRASSGKPVQGTIHLVAGRRGEKVWIQVSDDGAGPDFAKIRQRLMTQGLLSEQEVQSLTTEQLSQWLFHPGFSTVDIGEISGRGVGLDVVRDALQRIQGRIELTSRSGQGTTFSLILPVTISTIRVLTVWCAGQCFGIPTSGILKTGRIKASELREIKGTPVILLEGEPVRWVMLADVLQIGRPAINLDQSYHPYVVIRQDGRTLAIRVDVVDEEREVLLKPLGFPLSGMPGVLGGTIRPDGSVQLVLDISLDHYQRISSSWQHRVVEPSVIKIPRILVVDDSPTTRAMLRNVFIAAGYQVKTAVDGIDALEKLQIERPDLMVCDFEMPRLNGVDLTRQVKSRWNVPVILVTGREQEHHRREGLEAGADAYLTKSTFRGDSLLDVVRQFLDG